MNLMKTHLYPGKLALKIRCRKFLSGQTHFRDHAAYSQALERRIRRAFERVLTYKGQLIEGRRETVWGICPGENHFIPAFQTANYIAAHVARRVIGFGWPVRLRSRADVS
jgi:hypothetical protein